MIVNTEIELKPFSIDQAPYIFKIIDTERDYLRIWLPFIDSRQKVEQIEEYIEFVLGSDNQQFAIYFQGQCVGIIGFKDTDFDNRKSEIGYWLSQYQQGNGIVTQSVQKMLEFAFNELHLNRIQIKVAVDNKKSRAIPERLGFHLEGIERDGELLINNTYTDIAIYSILKKEYKG
ncbi:MAG: GNAT family protein [Dysgonomonas sp.]